MGQFKGYAGASEAQLKQIVAYQYAQDSTGLAKDGVTAGLGVTQTATPSKSIIIGAGMGIVQDAVGNGAVPLVNNSAFTLDVLTANPLTGVSRNDVVVFDAATTNNATETGGIRVIIGDPNVSPTDPAVPATAVKLARLRHAGTATTIPGSAIDDWRVSTTLVGAVGPWVSFTPRIYHQLATSGGFEISSTAEYGRWRYLGDRTVQAQASALIIGSSTDGVGIGLPMVASFRSYNCGTARATGPGTPDTQQGVAYMFTDKAKLVIVGGANAYLNVPDGTRISYSVVYEI